jgi:hypothetical protein
MSERSLKPVEAFDGSAAWAFCSRNVLWETPL